MSNRLTVRYNTSAGDHSASSVYENAASQYMFGKKDRLLNLSSTSATGAANRAQTALNVIAFPRSKEPSESGTSQGGEIRVALKFSGYYGVFDWLLTTSTSETVTNNKTQLGTLLAAYCAVNNFVSTDTSAMSATLPDDIEWIDPDSTYREKFEKLLAQGDASRQVLAWGVYDERRLVVEVSAGAAPETIHYYEHSITTQGWGCAISGMRRAIGRSQTGFLFAKPSAQAH
jgi:hypothetical protein